MQTGSTLAAAFVSSLLFGVSHLRHLFDRYEDFSPSSAQVAFQLLFTSVFGLYSSYVYVRGNSVVSSFLLHAYCNTLGLPGFRYLRMDIAEDAKRSIEFNLGISILYVIGIVGFFSLVCFY